MHIDSPAGIPFSPGNTKLFWNQATGQLGIGTTVPDTFLTIANATGFSAPPFGGIHLAGSGTIANIVLDGQATGPVLCGQRTQGTFAAKTAVTVGQALVSFIGRGFDGTVYSGNRGNCQFVTTENWTVAAHGTKQNFGLTKTGTIVATTPMSLTASGLVENTSQTVANLAAIPAAELAGGLRTYVTDALAPAFAVAVVGGGAVYCPVYYDLATATWRCG